MSDTIFALSSAPGRAGVAVIRVSGPQAQHSITRLAGAAPFTPRLATLRRLRDEGGAAIDQALVLWFPAPASFSGEDMAEVHIHGGAAIVGKVLDTLAGFAGCRPAEPGEFTRRAVENGKLDLTQAEAVADLIDAQTEGQRRQALLQYGGTLKETYENWRCRLITVLAWAEAAIDFSDEELPADLWSRSLSHIRDILKEIQTHITDSRRGEIVREGLYLTVIGPPNAGKSSLVNALARRNVAIVAEVAGTTRDIIEVKLDLGGYAVVVADTAGLREASETVESEGVRRALARAEASDLVLLLLDGTVADPLKGLPPEAVATASLTVWNKADLPFFCDRSGPRLSLKTGEGLDTVLETIERKVAEMLDRDQEGPVLTRARHRHALEQAIAALARALSATEVELFAEDLRMAVRAVGRITGRVDVEELLDVVFADFCIGK